MRKIMKEQCGAVIKVGPLESFEVELPENPTTGYRWQLASELGTALQLEDDSFQAGNEAVCGAGGVRRWRFRAGSEGATELAIHRRRSWEHRAAETFNVTIRVES